MLAKWPGLGSSDDRMISSLVIVFRARRDDENARSRHERRRSDNAPPIRLFRF
jgi:hypothetical protein